ncbi:MAG: hypothetical protein HC905_21570 [Bacteroidales bacterium]|nr:hypothetical protein [Bacteroidales bacterium]
MTEKQIIKIQQSIKRHRAALAAEKRKFGDYDDSAGRRYVIADLYMKISDYKGAITYKKWFDKNFPDDMGSALLSLNWSVAYYELGKMHEAKMLAIETGLQNVYLHHLLLKRSVTRIDMEEHGHDLLAFAEELVNYCKKTVTSPYLEWLTGFMESDEYKKPVTRYIALSKLLKDEDNREKRSELLNQIWDLEEQIREGIKIT